MKPIALWTAAAALALTLASCGQVATPGGSATLNDQAKLDAELEVRALELPCGGLSNEYLSSWSCITVDEAKLTASVTFTVKAGQNVQLTLVSYKAPTPQWDPDLVEQQVLFDYKTETFGPGTHTLTVKVPDCYFQVDFVRGEHRYPLTPENDYRVENGLIADKWGGDHACITDGGGEEGGEGCTPGYWKNHLDSWAGTGYAPTATVKATFDVTYGSTLLAALKTGGGQEKALMRHAVAALLNAASSGVDYEYTEAEVIAMVQAAFASKDYESAKDMLADANEEGCPLN